MLRARFIISILCIIAAGVWAYHNSFSGVFVLDDLRILDASHIHHLWPIWDVLKATSRPLVELSLAINYSLGGTNVFGYHLVNLLIHLSAALVLFGIVRRTFLTDSLRDRYGDASNGLALAIALLWVVHPLQTESVTYLIQRAESLMGLFYLLTLYCFIRGVTSEKQRLWHVLAIIACAAGMASKPIMVTAPLLVLLYDRTFIAGTFKQAFNQRKVLYLSLTTTWGLLAALLVLAPQDKGAGFQPSLSPLTYAQTQPGVLIHYLKLSFWPMSLCLDYAWPQAKTLKEITLPLLVINPLVLFTIWGLRTARYTSFFGIWFFLILIPTSSFIPIRDYAFEHRMYLPLAAVIGSVVLGGHKLLGLFFTSQKNLRQVTAIGCVTISALLLGLTTIRRNKDYHSEENIWRDTISKSQNNARAYQSLGDILYSQDRLKEAKLLYEHAVEINPYLPKVYNNLANLLDREARFEEARVLYEHALQLDPNNADIHYNFGVGLAQHGYLEEAKAHYLQALKINPDKPYYHYNLGNALVQQGSPEKAKTHFVKALELDPSFVKAENNLGLVLLQQGRLEEAKIHYFRALELNPKNAPAFNGLGAIFARQGHIEEAKKMIMQSLQLNPNDPDVKENLNKLLKKSESDQK